MGKKVRGAALRAKKRAREAVEEIQERQAEDVAKQSVTGKTDSELFVIDKTACRFMVPSQRKKLKAESGPNNKPPNSETEQVEKMLKKYNNNANKLAAVAEQGKKLLKQRYHRKEARGTTKADFDLWSSPNNNEAAGKNETAIVAVKTTTAIISSGIGSALAGIAPAHCEYVGRRKVSDADVVGTTEKKHQVAIDIAKPGQSYHPDPVAHQAVLKEAVQLELARAKALKDRETPLNAGGMTPETRALLVGDSDSSSDEEDAADNDGKEVNLAVGPLPKRTDKKTRAQRNKEKRIKRERFDQAKRKAEKKFINTISEVPRYAKELKKKAREKAELKQKILETQQQKLLQQAPGKDLHLKLSQANPIVAPTLPVALPSEIQENNSLRTIKPKGSLASERLVSLMDRNLAAKPKNNPSHAVGKRRKKSVKGKHNNQCVGEDFIIKG